MKDKLGQCSWAGLFLIFAGTFFPVDAISQSIADRMITPFVDPLLSLPPQLTVDHISGDSAECDNAFGSDRYMENEGLGLSDAVTFGLCFNPQIQSALASVKVQAAQVGGARAAYLPTIAAGVSRQNQKTRYSESGFSKDANVTNDARYVTLTWRLLDFGGRDANHRAASALLVAALASHDAALQKTLANVVGTYFDAQIARANRQAKLRGETLARQTWEIAVRRETIGAGARTDTLQAKTALAKAELDSGRANGGYEKSLAALKIAMGLRLDLPVRLLFSPAPDHRDIQETIGRDLTSWLSMAQVSHPALVAARAQLDSLREKLQAARSEGLPSLDFTHSRYINGRPNQGVSSTQSRESSIGLSVNIPIFDGFSSTYKVRAAQAQIEVKQAEVRDAESLILNEVVKAHADAVASLGNLDVSKRLIDAASEALHEVRIKYDKGIVDILDMLSVQLALADAEQERIRSLSEWSSARLRLTANAGVMGLKDLASK